MTAFKDLTPYAYGPPEEGALNVGWLGRWRPFRRGRPTAELLSRIAWLCLNEPVAQTRGSHYCERCHWKKKDAGHYLLVEGATPHLLGSNEIRVPGDGVVYAAPSLVLHYMVNHRYRPPAEFRAAAERLPNEQPAGWKVEKLTWKQWQRLDGSVRA